MIDVSQNPAQTTFKSLLDTCSEMFANGQKACALRLLDESHRLRHAYREDFHLVLKDYSGAFQEFVEFVEDGE